MTALWVHELADEFWSRVGRTATFPRNLEDDVCWALPVDVVEIPRLSIGRVNRWLAERQRSYALAMHDRRLRACILVHDGNGLLFVDETDPDDERRFSVAHEIAHYLVEYTAPRQQAARRLGADILPVLAGRRAASRTERLGALLGGVSLSIQQHLMERTPDGHLPGHDVSQAERQADDLALELLAPADAVRACVPAGAARADMVVALRQTFGLPSGPADSYARRLAPRPSGDPLYRRLFGAPRGLHDRD